MTESESWWTDEQKATYIAFIGEGAEEESQDPITKVCEHIIFESSSKGMGRKRKSPVIVEMVRYAGRCRIVREDGSHGIDGIASEVLGNTVLPQKATETFLKRLRRL